MRNTIAILTVLLSATVLADSVRSLDGKVYDGKATLDAAGVNVQPKGNQPPVKVPFSQLLRARFDSTDAGDPGDSSEAWSAVDIGETPQQGSHKFNKNQLTIESAGLEVVGRADSARLVYQAFRGNGEVTAKVTGAGQWRDKTAAGVMIRATADPAAPSVSLLISKDNGLYMVVRPSGGFDTTVTQIGKMRAPMHLKLTREATFIRAYRSADGKLWMRVGEVKVWMGEEPIAGAVAVSRENGMSAPVFESLRVASDDIKGATATDVQDIRALVRTGRDEPRKDNQKQVKLNQLTMTRGLPDAATVEMRFQLDGKYNIVAGQAFVNDKERGGGAVTLQIFGDDEKLFDSGKLTAENGASVSFNLPVAGKRELKLVAIDGGGGKPFYLAGFRNVMAIAIKPGKATPRNQSAVVVATDGATYAGVDVRRVSSERIEFTRGQRKDLSMPQSDVARILMPGFDPKMAEKIPATGSGVMLTNGDFYEGDIERFDAAGRVQVNSVIFGPREFNLRTDVSALVLRPLATDPTPAAFEVHAADGSLLGATSLSAEGSNLQVNDRHLGKMVLDAKSVRELRYGGDRLKWVADLRPRRVNPGPGRSAAESFVIDATPLGPMLRLLDIDYERGVSLSTGTSVSYDIEGRYNALISVAGVPAEVLPTTAVIFVIDVDGREAFRSPPRTSVQDPLPITVDTTNVKTVTLRVEPASGAALASIALFGDPLLIKSSP
jgi:hypothetical protein